MGAITRSHCRVIASKQLLRRVHRGDRNVHACVRRARIPLDARAPTKPVAFAIRQTRRARMTFQVRKKATLLPMLDGGATRCHARARRAQTLAT